MVHAWAAYQTKLNTLRFPVVKPKQDSFKNGEPIEMISFMIALGKKLNLPGFGENAIKGQDGKLYPFDKPEDLFLRAFENIAMDETPVPDASDEDIQLSGIESYIPSLKRICGENWRKLHMSWQEVVDTKILNIVMMVSLYLINTKSQYKFTMKV